MIINTIVAIVIAVLGLFMILGTKLMVRFQVWSQRAIMGAQFIPSARTYIVMRVVGGLLLILGIVIGSGLLGK